MSASELKKAVERFVKKEPGWEPFTLPPEKGAKAQSRSVGRPGASAESSGGGGVITEDDYSQREHWPARTVVTSDYLFAIEYQPIKSLLDVSGDRHTFKEPTS